MNRWLNALKVDKPVIVRIKNLGELVKSNLWFVIVCLVAAILHIYPILRPVLIIGDETLHLKGGLLLYEYIAISHHSIFQITFWTLVSLLVIMSILKVEGISILVKLKNRLFGNSSSALFNYFYAFLFLSFLLTYFLLLRNLPYNQMLIRYPPVSKFIYFLTYSAFSINHIFPRIIQLLFYLLCAGYLYRLINLFYDKDAALLGASIYLFLPVAFTYAYLGEIESGTIFFIVSSAFYFIRFVKDGDNRDLLIAAYLLGIGFLYKDPILLLLIICFAFLTVDAIRKRSLSCLMNLKILSLSIITIVPWMLISKTFNWRNYTFVLSNLTSLDGKLIKYIFLIQSNISVVIFILFVVAVFYVYFTDRNILTGFFGLLFLAYYFAIVSDMAALSPRLSMTLYPTIAIFVSIFIYRMIQYLKWKHSFKFCFIVLLTYLITICSVFPLNARFLEHENKKLHYYPSEQAMRWVKDNVKEGERILNLRILSSKLYSYKYSIDYEKIIDMPYSIDDVSTLDKLKEFYNINKLSYIMFPYSPAYIRDDIRVGIFEYLKKNPNNEFDEVAKFNIDENHIYVYKYKPVSPIDIQ